MELQQLTEQMLLAVTSLNRSCIPQSVQEPLKGENFLLDYLSAQNGCSTPGALREVLGVSAPRTAAMLRALEEKGMLRRCTDCCDRRRVVVHMTDLGRRTAEKARVAVRACAVCAPTARRAGHAGIDSAFEPHHGDRGTRLIERCALRV